MVTSSTSNKLQSVGRVRFQHLYHQSINTDGHFKLKDRASNFINNYYSKGQLRKRRFSLEKIVHTEGGGGNKCAKMTWNSIWLVSNTVSFSSPNSDLISVLLKLEKCGTGGGVENCLTGFDVYIKTLFLFQHTCSFLFFPPQFLYPSGKKERVKNCVTPLPLFQG